MGRKIIVISHNLFAEGLKRSVEMITGKHENLYAYGLLPGNNPADLLPEIEKQVETASEVIILADLVGGSMCNAATQLLTHKHVKLVGGVNLSLLLELVLIPEDQEVDLVALIGHAREAIKEVILEQRAQNDEQFF
ncbi:hypothetical protein NIE88_02555 [Sporolactobacillus shoreicorticis]|uniref:PTS sugar transporter subunit IIA n=1 Tax=Sporolactobacillus shoreicorticis TaxID=1923877 RepID=A0ABW5S1Y5_9BACL|nr:hypothetical protein [Sporolactobacillus shoreicorticis]MCO7124661.1 hypothetical protein [Sporolactobacillus shoreicorticis]